MADREIDAAFFAGTTKKSLLLCNLGHGEPSKLFPRFPRPNFEDFCTIE